jgi:hypothetical protein
MSVKLNSSSGGSVTLQEPTTASNFTLTLPAQTATVITDSSAILNIGSGQIYKDASGNVGVGQAYGLSKLTVAGQSPGANGAYATGPGSVVLNEASRTSVNDTGGLEFKTSVFGSGYGAKIIGLDNGTLAFGYRANSATYSESARIDASGNVLFNTTDTTLYNNTSGYGVCYRVNASFDVLSTSDNAVILNRTGTDGSIEEFRKSGTIVGSISVTGSATAYNTSSDYRLKNSVAPMTTGLETVSALNPVTYKWNVDDSDGEGFIAHELQEVIPHAVTGEKDAVDADGKPIHQGVDYSKIVVHLVAAIQELKADLDAAKAEIAALKGSA